MPRNNRPKRRDQAPRRDRRGHAPVRTTVVKPTGRCYGRLCFATEEIAAEALAEARAYKITTGNTGSMEKRHYECPDCGQYHLSRHDHWADNEEGS